MSRLNGLIMTTLVKTFKNIIFVALIGVIAFLLSGVVLMPFVGVGNDLRFVFSYSLPIVLMLLGVSLYDRFVSGSRQPVMCSIKGLNPLMLLCNLFLLVSISVALSPLMRLLPEAQQSVPTTVWAVVTMIFIAPIFEEILFRAKIFSVFRSTLSPTLSAVVTSLIFAVMHGQLSVALEAFVVGMVLSYTYISQRSVLAPIVLHIFNNIIAFVLVNFEYQGRTIEDFIGDLPFFNIIYAISLVIIIINLIFVILAYRRADIKARGYSRVSTFD